MSFFNRVDAGRQLADVLRARTYDRPLVVGIARGGVPIAAEVARRLDMPLEICVVRSLCAPGGVPIGAIAESAATYYDEARVKRLGLTADEVARVVAHEQTEVARLAALLRDTAPLPVRGHDVILIDEGVITVDRILAAARSLRDRGVQTIELATPIASAEALDALRDHLDHVICLEAEHAIVAVGARYADFSPISESQIINLLSAARADRGSFAAR